MKKPEPVDATPIRIHVVVSPELLKRLEDYRFTNRIRSQSEALRVLLEKGLGK